MRGWILIGLLCAAPALAQDIDQELDRIDTISGPAVLRRVGPDVVLEIAGQRFVAEGMTYAAFDQPLGDVRLVRFSAGGTACPALYAWLDPRPGSVRLTDLFGTCADLPVVGWTADAAVVTLPSLVAGEGKVDFVWDGKGLEVAEVPQGLAEAGLPPGGPAEAWVGRWSQDLLDAAEWQGPLQAMLGASALEDLRRMVSGPGYPFEVQGDWVVSQTCQAHNCGDTTAIVALRRADGALLVALWENGQGTRVFGDSSGAVPAGVTELRTKP